MIEEEGRSELDLMFRRGFFAPTDEPEDVPIRPARWRSSVVVLAVIGLLALLTALAGAHASDGGALLIQVFARGFVRDAAVRRRRLRASEPHAAELVQVDGLRVIVEVQRGVAEPAGGVPERHRGVCWEGRRVEPDERCSTRGKSRCDVVGVGIEVLGEDQDHGRRPSCDCLVR